MTERSDVLKKPIIVIGAPRSGTTFLGQVLSWHHRLHYEVEPRLTWRVGNDRKSDMLRAEDARPEVIRAIHENFEKAVLSNDRERLVEKSPANALRPAFVDAVFPDCKFVHILRHGVDSILSIRSAWETKSHGMAKSGKKKIRARLSEVRLSQAPYYAREVLRRFAPAGARGVVGRNVWGPRLPGIREMLRDMTVLEVSALQWRMCVEATCDYGRRLPADRYLEVRLEDFTEESLHKIMDFCELDPDSEVNRIYGERYDSSKPGGQRKNASPEELAVIRRWAGPTLAWLGYEAPWGDD